MSTQATSNLPPPLPRLDAQLFRQKLAGLADPDCLTEDGAARFAAEHKKAAVEMCLMLATHFNRRTLVVTSLWSRIGSGLMTSAAKVQDGDIGRLCTICLEHVKAIPSILAADVRAAMFIDKLSKETQEWRQSFVRYLVSHSYAVLIFGRQGWEQHKAAREEDWRQWDLETAAIEAEVAQ